MLLLPLALLWAALPNDDAAFVANLFIRKVVVDKGFRKNRFPPEQATSLIFELPFSRAQETEADEVCLSFSSTAKSDQILNSFQSVLIIYFLVLARPSQVGLLFAAKACFDVREAPVFWGLMHLMTEVYCSRVHLHISIQQLTNKGRCGSGGHQLENFRVCIHPPGPFNKAS